jgi:MFS family permease
MSIMQARVPGDKFGRVSTLLISAVLAASPISLALAGPIADWIGIRAWFGLSAVASLLITLYFGGSRRLRDFDAGDAMTERRDETTGAPSGAVV